MNLRLHRYGATGILLRWDEQDSLACTRGLLRWVDVCRPDGLRDAVAGHDSLLLEFATSNVLEDQIVGLESELSGVDPVAADEAVTHRIPVSYDGPDLGSLATRLGLSVDEVIARHAVEYDVVVVGFSPGFPYLGPLDSRLHVPRRDRPRLRVPAGSVAIGGGHTGIYPVGSPGGWWLIGSTKAELFSLNAAMGNGSTEAFLLRPGDRVCLEKS